MTNTKSHTPFRLVLTLDDLERTIDDVLQKRCAQHKNLNDRPVSGDVDIRGGRQTRVTTVISTFSLTFFSETLDMRPQLFSDLTSNVYFDFRAGLAVSTVRVSKNNCLKTNKDRQHPWKISATSALHF